MVLGSLGVSVRLGVKGFSCSQCRVEFRIFFENVVAFLSAKVHACPLLGLDCEDSPRVSGLIRKKGLRLSAWVQVLSV